jgi:hypothetical protein
MISKPSQEEEETSVPSFPTPKTIHDSATSEILSLKKKAEESDLEIKVYEPKFVRMKQKFRAKMRVFLGEKKKRQVEWKKKRRAIMRIEKSVGGFVHNKSVT